MNHRSKPRNPTTITPEIIIGVAMAKKFTVHFKTWNQYGGDDFKRNNALQLAGITTDDLTRIGEIHDALHDHGFYPTGLNVRGEIRWSIALKCGFEIDTDDEEFQELKKLSVNEIRKRANQGFKTITNKGAR